MMSPVKAGSVDREAFNICKYRVSLLDVLISVILSELFFVRRTTLNGEVSHGISPTTQARLTSMPPTTYRHFPGVTVKANTWAANPTVEGSTREIQSPAGEPRHRVDRQDRGELGGSRHPWSSSPVSQPRPTD